jgi:hypothetical protein
MDVVLTELFSFPLILYVFPGLILLLFWLVSLLGFIDVEIFDFGLDLDSDSGADASNIFQKLGLDGVPLLIVLTLIDFYGLVFSYTAKKYLLPLFDGALSDTANGIVLIIVSLILAVPLSAMCVKPLRKLFVVHQGQSKHDMTGTLCVSTTQTVTDSFGQAITDDGMIITVRASVPNDIVKGSRIVLLEFIEQEDCYTVISESELKKPYHTA